MEELRLTRTFPAPPEKVYRAWTNAQELSKWFAPSAEFQTEVEVDLRIGGKYRISMLKSDGNRFTVSGIYKEIVPYKKLVYTWKWEHEPQMGDTIVTVEFRAAKDSTEVVLLHKLFASNETKEEHGKGWTGCLNRLGEYIEV